MMFLFCSRVQDTLTCCCSQFSKASPLYFTHTKCVQIVVPEFPGDISSPFYLIKCSHVPTPKFRGSFGCHEGSPRRLNQVGEVLAALPHIRYNTSTIFQLRKLSSGSSHVARRHSRISSSIVFSVPIIKYFYGVRELAECPTPKLEGQLLGRSQ